MKPFPKDRMIGIDPIRIDISRNTPHAFSHFTFEASGAEQIVVDIQGAYYGVDFFFHPGFCTEVRYDWGVYLPQKTNQRPKLRMYSPGCLGL